MTEKKNSLLAKLDQIEMRYSEIEKQISDPEIASNSAKLISLSKEQGKLRESSWSFLRFRKEPSP